MKRYLFIILLLHTVQINAQKISFGVGYGTSLARFELKTQLGEKYLTGVSYSPSFNYIGAMIQGKTMETPAGYLYYGIEPGIVFDGENTKIIGTIGIGNEMVFGNNRNLLKSIYLECHLGYHPEILSAILYGIDYSFFRISFGFRLASNNSKYRNKFY